MSLIRAAQLNGKRYFLHTKLRIDHIEDEAARIAAIVVIGDGQVQARWHTGAAGSISSRRGRSGFQLFGVAER